MSSDGWVLLAALVFAIVGMGSFAISIAAHWHQVADGRVQSDADRRAFRLAGAACLAAAFGICAAADPLLMAVLVWTMMLTVAAALVAAALALQRRHGSAEPGDR